MQCLAGNFKVQKRLGEDFSNLLQFVQDSEVRFHCLSQKLKKEFEVAYPQFKKMLDFLGDTFLMTRLAKQAGFQVTAGTGRRE